MKNRRILAIVGTLLLSGLGCGQPYSGTYTGTESIGLTTTGIGTVTPSAITINIVQTSNDDVSGTWQGTFGAGSFQGRPEKNRINAVVLTLQQSSMLSSMGTVIPANTPVVSTTTAPTAAQTTCGPYIGILNQITPTSLEGTLTIQNATAAVPAGATLVTNNLCPQFRKVTTTR
jgi:hypothetical protein